MFDSGQQLKEIQLSDLARNFNEIENGLVLLWQNQR